MSVRTVERDQMYLMPPSVADWLPQDHLAYFVLDAVEALDISVITAAYPSEGPGAPSYDPTMMLALLIYAYCVNLRSSRRIESACVTDIAFRVIAANQWPDHATVSRFRARHQGALEEIFVGVLRLCRAAGLTKVGVVALDGTKMEANASMDANRDPDALRADIEAYFAEATATDAAEDAAFGETRGDELLPGLATRSERRAKLAAAKAAIDAEEAARAAEYEADAAAREAKKAAGDKVNGRPPNPNAKRRRRKGQHRVNLTDPDSRLQLAPKRRFLQGYNAQAVVDENQIVIAAVVVPDQTDAAQLNPMTAEARANAHAAGCGPIDTVLADAGYINENALTNADPHGPELLVAGRNYPGRRRGVHTIAMAEKMATPEAKAVYDRRAQMVESVFGNTKANRGMIRFSRRGLPAVDAEWKLIHVTGNLMKLFRSGLGVPKLTSAG